MQKNYKAVYESKHELYIVILKMETQSKRQHWNPHLIRIKSSKNRLPGAHLVNNLQ